METKTTGQLCSFFKYNKLKIIVLTSLTFIFMGFRILFTIPDPPENYTGSPSDGNDCTLCHADFAVNSGTGVTTISTNIPAGGYVPSSTYSITVSMSQASITRFQFELSPQNASTGAYLGTLVPIAGNTKLIGTKDIAGVFASIDATGGNSWTFSWIAPAAGLGPVTFYCAFNAADNDGTEAGDYIYTKSLVVTESTVVPLSCSISSSVNITCNGLSNGSATVTASNGTAPYTYIWSNGDTTQTATGLSAGSKSVTVTDASSATCISNVTISEPSALSVNLSQTPDSGSSTGTASVVASGGTSPYTYLWSNSQTTATATGLASGTFLVTVTDFKGCTKTGSVTVIALGSLYGTITSTNVSCNNACDGSAMITAYDGTSPYTYLWSNGATTATVTGLCDTIYFVTITDSVSATFTDSVTITQPEPFVASVLSSSILCNGDTATITVSASGGTLPYTGTGSFTELAGTYSYTLTDANGCSATDSITISEPTPISTTMNVTADTSDLGIATVTATGGTSPYSYLWSNSQTASTATGLLAGMITVTVTDDNGCEKVDSVDIPIFDVIDNNIFQSSVRIFPNPGNGEFSVEINTLKNDNCVMTIMDVKGQRVYQEELMITNGKNIHSFSLEESRKGIYIVQIITNSEVIHIPVTLIK